MNKIKKSWLLAGLVVSLGIFSMALAANINNMTNLKVLGLDGSLYFTDAQDPIYGTMPTASTSDQFSVKVPFYNGSGSTMVRGSVVLASTTAGANIYGSMASILSTTSVLGVCDGTYLNGQKGMMTILGYASVLSTGAVNIGDILVSSNSVSAGYAGKTTGTQVVGTTIGKAVIAGSGSATAGGLVTVLIGSN